MDIMKSLIKRRFGPEFYPENAYFDAGKICEKTKNIELLEDEEVIITVDNEPGTEIIDCCVLTNKRIISLRDNALRSIYFDDIKGIEIPHQKTDPNKHYEHLRMNLTDKTRIRLINGDIEEVRIICGGVYSLGNLRYEWRMNWTNNCF
jgi:hypothetical protein